VDLPYKIPGSAHKAAVEQRHNIRGTVDYGRRPVAGQRAAQTLRHPYVPFAAAAEAGLVTLAMRIAHAPLPLEPTGHTRMPPVHLNRRTSCIVQGLPRPPPRLS
jgi:hypothetical protein